jgi:hypothetical protein
MGRPLLHHHLELSAARHRRTLRRLPFTVPAGTAALTISLHYTPRGADGDGVDRLIEEAVQLQLAQARAAGVVLGARPEPPRVTLRNLLNLVLRDPAGRPRGRWDHNPGQDVIGPRWASPGYVAGELPPGAWEVVLEVHELVTARCDVELTIAGLREAPPPPPAPRPVPTTAPAREFCAAPAGGWYRGELHCHSSASDGDYAPEALAERAAALGLDFIALTDHNTTAGLGALRKAAAGAPLSVIGGCEITTFRGHLLALGVDEAPDWHKRSIRELAAWVRSRGGLFGLAHPFVLGNPVCCGCRLEALAAAGDLDLIEVWSRGDAERVATLHALRRLDELRRGGQRTVAIAGRDWHGRAQEGRRFPATVVRAASAAPADLLAGIAAGGCYMAVREVAVDLELARGDGRAGIGGSLSGARRADARVTVRGLERPALLRLLCGGEPVREERVRDGVLEHEGVILAPGGVRVELWDPAAGEGELLALTNPVDP